MVGLFNSSSCRIIILLPFGNLSMCMKFPSCFNERIHYSKLELMNLAFAGGIHGKISVHDKFLSQDLFCRLANYLLPFYWVKYQPEWMLYEIPIMVSCVPVTIVGTIIYHKWRSGFLFSAGVYHREYDTLPFESQHPILDFEVIITIDDPDY